MQEEILQRLLAVADQGAPAMADTEYHIPVDRYISPQRFAEERDLLFRRHPLIIAHESEVAAPGDYLTCDVLGLPILLVRDDSAKLHAFLNVCRHRGTRLVGEPCGRGKRSLVCPYHNWTYDLQGALCRIPCPEGFPGVDPQRRGLVPVPVEGRHGLVWLLPQPGGTMDVGKSLGALDAELAGLGFDRHLLFRRAAERRRANWKLIMDAFLESYHIARLHRASIYPFFLDNVSILDAYPPHLRAAVARKGIRDPGDFRSRVSMAYFIFPGMIFILHPDYVSLLILIPEGPDTTLYTHLMIVPQEEGASSETTRQHWERSYDLIEGHVFQKEDLFTAESIHAGLSCGANEYLTAGRYEYGLRMFHEIVEDALREGRAKSDTAVVPLSGTGRS